MDTLNGIPAHPLLVHIPVALLPLAALGVVVMLLKRAWYERYRWAVLVIAGIGTVGAFLATSSGEGLEEMIGRAEGREAVRAIQEHAEAGEMARTLAIVFFVALAAWVLVPWFLERRASATPATPATGDVLEAAPATQHRSAGPSWLRPALMVITVVAAVASMVSIVDAGHSGASKAWEELSQNSSGG